MHLVDSDRPEVDSDLLLAVKVRIVEEVQCMGNSK